MEFNINGIPYIETEDELSVGDLTIDLNGKVVQVRSLSHLEVLKQAPGIKVIKPKTDKR